jgi:hypothetical protein
VVFFYLCVPIRCLHLFGGAARVGVVSEECDLPGVEGGVGCGVGVGFLFLLRQLGFQQGIENSIQQVVFLTSLLRSRETVIFYSAVLCTIRCNTAGCNDDVQTEYVDRKVDCSDVQTQYSLLGLTPTCDS